MRAILGKTLRFFAGVSLFGWWAGALFFHGYTTWAAYQISGFFAAATTFTFPLLAQIYWAYWAWSAYDLFWSTFTLGLIAAVLVRILSFALYAIAEVVSPEEI